MKVLFIVFYFLFSHSSIYSCSMFSFRVPNQNRLGFSEDQKTVYWLKEKTKQAFQTRYNWIEFSQSSGHIIRSTPVSLPFPSSMPIYLFRDSFVVFPQNPFCPQGQTLRIKKNKHAWVREINKNLTFIPKERKGWFVWDQTKKNSTPFSFENSSEKKTILRLWLQKKTMAILEKTGENFSVFRTDFQGKKIETLGMFNPSETFLIQEDRHFVISKSFSKKEFRILSSERREDRIPFFSFWSPEEQWVEPLIDSFYLVISVKNTNRMVIWNRDKKSVEKQFTSEYPYHISAWDYQNFKLFVEESGPQKESRLKIFDLKTGQWKML